MSILKKDIRNNTGIRIDGIKPHQVEERIANAILQDKIDLKDTPLSRMTGLKTVVTYYHKKSIGSNNYLVNIDTIGSTDPSNNLIIKIKDFIILCLGELTSQTDQKEIGVEVIADGQAKILPKTIKPMIGDYFIMTVYNKPCLFKVSNVNKTVLEDDMAYEISYYLVEENPDEELRRIESTIDDTFEFVYSHVGTSFRTLFRTDEYAALEKLDSMYRNLSSLFNEYFYDSDKNTYILVYNSLDTKDEQPYVLAKESAGGESLSPPSLNLSNSWYNSQMYDRMLVEFITRNGLFDYVDKRIFRISQLRTDIEKWYTKTIFYAIENQNYKRIVFKYYLPSPITRVTIATSLNLYGIVSLEPMADKFLDSLDLYPPGLLSYILWGGKERSIDDCILNTYEDILEFICETIGLYVNKKDTHILKRLLIIYEHIDEFFDLSINKHYLFYIFPILAFVIRKAMDRLSDSNYNINDM
jgi:arsenate reductase-like glutaredoxin family protein